LGRGGGGGDVTELVLRGEGGQKLMAGEDGAALKEGERGALMGDIGALLMMQLLRRRLLVERRSLRGGQDAWLLWLRQ
jgi:hypothetical protein